MIPPIVHCILHYAVFLFIHCYNLYDSKSFVWKIVAIIARLESSVWVSVYRRIQTEDKKNVIHWNFN